MCLLRLPVILLVIWSGLLFSQRQNFSIYSIDEGIPQSQVHCIIQDQLGYLWFGTDGGGFCRYDGKEFQNYTVADGLSNDLVYDVAVDSQGGMWLATAKGVSRFINGKPASVPEKLKVLNDLIIRKVVINKEGKVIFGTNKGLFIYTSNDIFRIEELDEYVVSGLLCHSNGKIYAGTNNGMYEVDLHGKVRHWGVDDGLNHGIIHDFIEYNGQLLMGTERGLNTWKDGKITGTISIPGTGNAKMIVRDLVLGKKKGYWVVTLDNGCFEFDGEHWFRYGKAEGLGIDGSFCLYQDHEGNTWIGTDGNGAAKLGKRVFTSLGLEQGMPSEMILSILKTKKGQWWYGNQEGVTYYNGEKYKHFGSAEGLSDEKVWSVTEDQEGKIWVTTYGSGIYIYNGKSFQRLSEKDGLSSNNVRSVFHDSRKRIWVATANGLNVINNGKIKQFFKKDGTGSDRFLRTFEDKNKNIWVGTSGGGVLKVIENKDSVRFQRYSTAEGMADDVILSITEDNSGRIWTGNFGGISCIDPRNGKVRKITRMDGLSSNTVYAIAFVNDSTLLVGTNSGIDKLNIFQWEKNGKVHAIHYGKEEGFKGIECNTASLWHDDDGSIWFGTIKGVFRYDPLLDFQSHTPPILRLEEIRLFFQKAELSGFGVIPAGQRLPLNPEFPYNRNHLTFEMSALSFTIPSGVLYSYKLEGLDKDWSLPSNSSVATYSNLPHGRFTFLFKATNGDGVWSEEVYRYSFTIKPPFWKTWWFYSLVSVFILVSIWAFVTYRLRRMKQIQLYLEKEVNLKTKELREEKEIVEKQNVLIAKKNKDITSSIHYAQRIQESILPSPNKLNELIPESFIYFKPKDIVSGDFYWFTRQNGCTLVAAVDCTGHGVPGAFMSLIGNNLLNHIANNLKISDPKIILEKLHEGVVHALKKREMESDTVDGMDVSLCVIHHKEKLLEYASTGRPMLMFQKNNIQKIKVGKQPVGLVSKKIPVFEKTELNFELGDSFYIFTDGYCDQFGGPEEDKYMEGQFQHFLSQIQHHSLDHQRELLDSELHAWKGPLAQIDDILVIGCRMG